MQDLIDVEVISIDDVFSPYQGDVHIYGIQGNAQLQTNVTQEYPKNLWYMTHIGKLRYFTSSSCIQ